MKNLIDKVDFFKSLVEQINNFIGSEDWDNFGDCFIERKKLEILIVLKVLNDFGLDVSMYKVPCTVYALSDVKPNKIFRSNSEADIYSIFEEFYDNLVLDMYSKLGWEVHKYSIDDDWYDYIIYEDDDIWFIDEDNITELIGTSYTDFPLEVHNMFVYLNEYNANIPDYYYLSNKRLGVFLKKAEEDSNIKNNKIYKDIKKCVEVLNTPLNNSLYDGIVGNTISFNGSYSICYFFVKDQMTNDGVISLNYVVTNLIYACILNILLGKAYEIYNLI